MAQVRVVYDRESLWLTAMTDDVLIAPDGHVLVKREGELEWRDCGELAPGVTHEEAEKDIADASGSRW